MEIEKSFIAEIKSIIINSRETAIRAVDNTRVIMYWHIGQRIFEEEQQGKERADYGKYIIRSLAQELEPEFGTGFGQRQLELMRQFHRTFPITNTHCIRNWVGVTISCLFVLKM